jgi:hypothetical protein
MAQEQRRSGDNSEDDLFDQLDELIGRHQTRAPRRRAPPTVPTLTEAVAPALHQLEIPVLNEVVEIPYIPSGAAPSAELAADAAAAPIDKHKQLQVALYLRLRQRLDQEVQAALAAHSVGAGSAVDRAMAQLARELRNALPAVVREAVEQVFAREPGQNGEDSKL